MVSTGHVLARAPVHAGVGIAFVLVDITVLTAPSGVTGTFIAGEEINTSQLLLRFYVFNLKIKPGLTH